MNTKIQIISDGSCDLSPEAIAELGIDTVPFYMSFDGAEHIKEKAEEVRAFYQKMIDNPSIFPKTSCPSPLDYEQVFTKHLENGKEIICFCIYEGFSSSINSAITARVACLERFQDAKISIIDSRSNTVLQGLILREACRLRDEGKSFEEIVDITESSKKKGRIFFTVQGLEYLRNGGRVSKLTATIGAIIKINPIIIVREGETSSGGLALGRKMALKKVIETVKAFIAKEKKRFEDFVFSIGYGYNIEEAEDFRRTFMESCGIKKCLLEQIGSTMAVHTGPHPLGVACLQKF